MTIFLEKYVIIFISSWERVSFISIFRESMFGEST